MAGPRGVVEEVEGAVEGGGAVEGVFECNYSSLLLFRFFRFFFLFLSEGAGVGGGGAYPGVEQSVYGSGR